MKTYPWQPTYYLQRNMNSILDVGCNVGALLQCAAELGYNELFGIEINPQAAITAKKRLLSYPNSSIVQGSADQIPFKNNLVDVATCCEVLEHVPSNLRPQVISEIHRILKPGAALIITVPAAGWFAFLDPANWRLAFPKIFEFFSKLVKGKGREAGFEGQKHGIVWHHHFQYKEIADLLTAQGFIIEVHRGRGALLSPLLNWLEFPFYRYDACNNIIFKIIRYVHDLDVSLDYGRRISYNHLIVARKCLN
jgi:SAM-dependent methyltransferase